MRKHPADRAAFGSQAASALTALAARAVPILHRCASHGDTADVPDMTGRSAMFGSQVHCRTLPWQPEMTLSRAGGWLQVIEIILFL
jgi:hypothetical protein